MAKFNLNSLSTFNIAGERVDESSYYWVKNNLPSTTLLNDNYWETESGWPISTNFGNLHRFSTKAGSSCKPNIGFKVEILDQSTFKPLPINKLGIIAMKLPLPPCSSHTIYNDE